MGVCLPPERTGELATAATDKIPTPIASAGAGSAGRGVRCLASIPSVARCLASVSASSPEVVASEVLVLSDVAGAVDAAVAGRSTSVPPSRTVSAIGWSSSAPPPGASKMPLRLSDVSSSTSAISSTLVTSALTAAIPFCLVHGLDFRDDILKKLGMRSGSQSLPLGSTAPRALATDARLIWRCGSWWKAFCPRRGPNV